MLWAETFSRRIPNAANKFFLLALTGQDGSVKIRAPTILHAATHGGTRQILHRRVVAPTFFSSCVSLRL